MANNPTQSDEGLRENLILELTKIDANQNRQDVENELMPIIDAYAKAYSLQERINELNRIVLNWDGLSLYSIDRRITDLEKELEALK